MTACLGSDVSECRTCTFETVRGFFKRKTVVSLLRISGVIGRGSKLSGIGNVSFEMYESLIEKAFKVPGCKAVILAVNSPGGAPAQCEMIADQIIRLSREKNIPVYSFAEDLAASAGYWILAAGNELYANKTSLVGSIGVLYAGFGFTEALKRLGVERRVHHAGKKKMILDVFREEKEEDVKLLREMQHEMHMHFKNYVISRRRDKLASDSDEIFSGMFWLGEKALELGLIDGINNYNRFLSEKYGKNVKVVHIKNKQSWLSKTFLCSIDALFIKARDMISFSRFGL